MSGRFRFDPLGPGATLALCEAAIHAFLPGISEIGPPALATLLRTTPPILLDVRAPEEHAIGRIPGARLAPPGTAPLTPAEVAGTRTVVLACSVGLRSGRMACDLVAAGIPRARLLNLRGGIFRWARLGLPMIDDIGPTTNVHSFDPRWARLLQV